MRLGIDFGTTRLVAAACDRGNYPVLAFDCPDGAAREWVPPLVAVRDGLRIYGWEAWAAQGEPGVVAVRSLKRVLADSGPGTRILLSEEEVPLQTVLEEMLQAFRSDLMERSTLRLRKGERFEVLLGVPANANSNQRFLTVEAFRGAGFEVLGLLNEPSAASIEYAHRLADAESAVVERLLVYDLGGGTFDASLVSREETTHSVLASESIPTLGGDDFDDHLAELALDIAGLGAIRASLTQAEEFVLLEECRAKKEALHPNTRRMIIDLDQVRAGWGQVPVPVADYYDVCAALVDETLHATDDLLARVPAGESPTLYVTGGASELPLVSRLLRERFGRRMKRSAYTRSATAIGLAIQAGGRESYQLRERFSRWFGVWREADAGRRLLFDPLFEKGIELPAAGAKPLSRARSYWPVHNIGHFRYLECSQRGSGGEPSGEVAAWDEIRFPFDPSLQDQMDLGAVPVAHSPDAEAQEIEEEYTADASGAVRVRIANKTAGYSRTYRLGRWAAQDKTLAPQKTPRQRRAAPGKTA